MPDYDAYLFEGEPFSDPGHFDLPGYVFDIDDLPPPPQLSAPPPPRPVREGKSELGTDVSIVLDADSHWSLVTGQPNLARAIARRLSTPRGGLFYAPTY